MKGKYLQKGFDKSEAFLAGRKRIGVLNYPELEWKMLRGDLHTVPVGYDADGAARVVMDILNFDFMTADESIAAASMTVGCEPSWQWELVFRAMEETVVSIIRAARA